MKTGGRGNSFAGFFMRFPVFGPTDGSNGRSAVGSKPVEPEILPCEKRLWRHPPRSDMLYQGKKRRRYDRQGNRDPDHSALAAKCHRGRCPGAPPFFRRVNRVDSEGFAEAGWRKGHSAPSDPRRMDGVGFRLTGPPSARLAWKSISLNSSPHFPIAERR